MAVLLLFLGNETREKSGFVSYVSISLCFDFDPTPDCLLVIIVSRPAKMVPLPKNHIQRRTLGQLLGICFVCLFASNQHSAQASMWRPECDEACPELLNHFKAIDLDSSNHTGVKWKCRAEMKKCVVAVVHRLLAC